MTAPPPPARTGPLSDRFEVHAGKPLPALSADGLIAVSATDLVSPNKPCFALLVEPHVPVRYEIMQALCGLTIKGMLTPLDFGVVEWPSGHRRLFAVLFDDRAGGRLVTDASQAITAWPEKAVVEFVTSSCEVLALLAAADLTHRNIRPTNILFGDPGRKRPSLGECITCPPGYRQPAAYEPIESMLALPAGRGNGYPGDDLYALGITILALLGQRPGARMSEAELLDAKLRQGSYAALTNGFRPSRSLSELLSGLLADDPDQRWSVSDLKTWTTGQRPTPRPAPPTRIAGRPLLVGGEECVTARLTARALNRMGDPAAALIREKPFSSWVLRSLADPVLVTSVENAAGTASDKPPYGALADGWLVARTSMALDPASVIRYRGLGIAAEAIGLAIAVAAATGSGEVPILAEMLEMRLPQFWLSRQAITRSAQVNVISGYQHHVAFLEDETPGGGVERLMYEMVPGLHCLSPLIERFHVDNVQDLLGAIELALKGRKQVELPLDRHIAAFVIQRARALVGAASLPGLTNALSSQRALTTLKLCVRLQAAHGPEAVPTLSALLGREVRPLIDTLHNRATRVYLAKQLDEVAATGHLAPLLQLVDDPAIKKADTTRFAQATVEYRTLRDQSIAITHELKEIQPHSEFLGEIFGRWAVNGLAILIVAATLVMLGAR